MKYVLLLLNMKDIVKSDVFVAGKSALASLKDARDFLEHARNWGVVDLLSGGLIPSCMKYSDIKEYKKKVKKAELELRKFSDRLECVGLLDELDIEFDGILKTIDLLRDNIWVDYIVQCHIKEAISRLDETIATMERLLSELLREDMIDYFKGNR